MKTKQFEISIGSPKKVLFWEYVVFDENKYIDSEILEKELENLFGLLNVRFFTNIQNHSRRIMITDQGAGMTSPATDLETAFSVIKKYFPDAKEVLKEGGPVET